MKLLIAGAAGQVGQELTRELGTEHEVLALSSSQLDVTRLDRCLEAARSFRPDAILNAAAYTKVDDCEILMVRAYAVNAAGARNLALAAESVKARCLYLSTDYVFNGRSDRPYKEFDPTDPINAYGRSKLAGEELTRSMTHRHFIVRTSWVCGYHGSNFVKTIRQLAASRPYLEVVHDQRGCPTFAADLARAIGHLVQTECYGTYHVTNQGDCTWYEFATEILRRAGSPVEVRPVTSDHFARPAKRPAFSVLDHVAWRAEGFPSLRPWQEALQELLTHLD